MTAFLVDQPLRFCVDGPGMVTTLSSRELASLLTLYAFLRTHVAFMMPLFLAALLTWKRPTELTWSEVRQLSAAWTEGFRSWKALDMWPRLACLGCFRLPSLVRAALTWHLIRLPMVKDLGEFGPAETRALIDGMIAAAPGKTPQLLALRP